MTNRVKFWLVGILALMMSSGGENLALADNPQPTTFQAQPNVEHTALTPIRPANAAAVQMTVGIFERYEYVKGPVPEMLLTLRDPAKGSNSQYLLSNDTTLNGKPLTCTPEVIFPTARFCGELPSDIIPGKTYLALLFWSDPYPEFPQYRGTDAIESWQPSD